MPAAGPSISCKIVGIMMSTYRNIRCGTDTTLVDMAITMAVEITTKAIAVGKVMARDTAEVKTETEQDQIESRFITLSVITLMS